jgi:hypothetical protein
MLDRRLAPRIAGKQRFSAKINPFMKKIAF